MTSEAIPPTHSYPYLADVIGNTPIVRLTRLEPPGSVVLAKLEGANPAGSVKDRAAFSMIEAAVESGQLKPGAEIIEATSGNTGIALAAAAASQGYGMVLVIPEGSSQERLDAMRAYGAQVVETEHDRGMEHARDVAESIAKETGALRIDQFANPANPAAHFRGTAVEIAEQGGSALTHVVCAMGTTGTVTGVAQALASIAPTVKVVGV